MMTEKPTKERRQVREYSIEIVHPSGGTSHYWQFGFDGADAIGIVLAMNPGARCVRCKPMPVEE